MKNRKYLILLSVTIAFFVAIFVYANPIEFTGTARNGTSTGTTTAMYMSAGNGTTTALYDSFKRVQGGTSNDPTAALKLEALVFVSATTGVPTLNLSCETSMDNIDYYPMDCYNTGTTTNMANISGAMSSYTFVFASSTCAVGGSAPATNISTCTRAFPITPVAQYTRIIGSLASTTVVSTGGKKDNANVLIQLVPTKERSK